MDNMICDAAKRAEAELYLNEFGLMELRDMGHLAGVHLPTLLQRADLIHAIINRVAGVAKPKFKYENVQKYIDAGYHNTRELVSEIAGILGAEFILPGEDGF